MNKLLFWWAITLCSLQATQEDLLKKIPLSKYQEFTAILLRCIRENPKKLNELHNDEYKFPLPDYIEKGYTDPLFKEVLKKDIQLIPLKDIPGFQINLSIPWDSTSNRMIIFVKTNS